MTSLQSMSFSLVLLATLAVVARGGEGSGKTKVLDPTDKQAKKLVVTSSQIGYRNTLVFYTFPEQKAVLRVSIDNKNTDFPAAATVFTFADNVTDEDLSKWLNNQHSDGIYPEVPEPVAMGNIPAAAFKVLSHKLAGKEQKPFGNFDKYTVEFQVRGAAELNGAKIKDFSDSAAVFVKTE